MSSVQRLCEQCGRPNPLDARYCGHCGYDTHGALPAQQVNLPAVIGRAALPVLVGAAGLAVRAGWRLLQSQWARDMAKQALNAAQSHVQSKAQAPQQPQPSASKPAPQPPAKPASTQIAPAPSATPRSAPHAKRTVHIRSAWRVSDGRGGYQQGMTEHTIEIND